MAAASAMASHVEVGFESAPSRRPVRRRSLRPASARQAAGEHSGVLTVVFVAAEAGIFLGIQTVHSSASHGQRPHT